ncbi:hypothetical protein FS837_004471, partial [Tulasnella sp. UAMH 9824]
FVVWCLEQSFVKLWGLAWTGSQEIQVARDERLRSRPNNFHAAPTPGSPGSPSSDPLKDGPCHNEITVTTDLLEPNEPTTVHSLPSDSTEEAISNPHLQTDPAQTNPPDPVFQTPKANALYQPNFEPTKSFFRGFVQQPGGKPSRGGSFSDVFRCPIQFVTPSKEHPTEVAVKVLRRVGLDDRPETEADERLQR